MEEYVPATHLLFCPFQTTFDHVPKLFLHSLSLCQQLRQPALKKKSMLIVHKDLGIFQYFWYVVIFDHTTYSSAFDSRVHLITALLSLISINRLVCLNMLTSYFPLSLDVRLSRIIRPLSFKFGMHVFTIIFSRISQHIYLRHLFQ